MSSSNRPLNPPFNKTSENGRYWCKTEDLGKLPPELVQKLATSMQNPGGDWIEFQGYFYRAEKGRDGKGMFLVQKTKEEIDADKNKQSQGGFKRGGGRPITLAADDFYVATVDTEVRAKLKEGYVFVVSDHGLQVGTMAVQGGGQAPDVVNGLFMVKPKKAE